MAESLFHAELAADAENGGGGDAVEVADLFDGSAVQACDLREGVAGFDSVVDLLGLRGGLSRLCRLS